MARTDQRYKAARGVQHWCHRLNDEKVREMRRLHYEKGLCIKCICLLHGVNYQTGWGAINYVTWRHVIDE